MQIFHKPPIIPDLGEYFTVIIGLATILVLASTITFGFLTYYFQSIDSERIALYANFKDEVSDLKEALDDLNRDGLIDRSYDKGIVSLQTVRLAEFPIDKDFYNESMAKVLDLLLPKESQFEALADRDRVIYALFARATHVEETINAIEANQIKQIRAQLLQSPVTKSFKTTILVVFAILLGVLHYGGVYAAVLDGLAFGVGCMVMLLFSEISFHTRGQLAQYPGFSQSNEDEDEDYEDEDDKNFS